MFLLFRSRTDCLIKVELEGGDFKASELCLIVKEGI